MTKKYLTMGALAAATFGVVNFAAASEPSTADLMRQINELQNKLQQIENRQSNALNKADVDATVSKVLADADRRSQMLQMDGFTAGHNGSRFGLRSANGDYSLMPYFQYQLRNVTNWMENDKASGDDRLQNGWEIRRMKMGFDGNAISQDLTYYFLWSSGSTSGGLTLEQAWIQYLFADNMSFRAGQFRNPTVYEGNTSSAQQLAADRSLTNVVITGANEAFTQGVMLLIDQDDFQFALGFTDGFVSGNTDWQDPSVNSANFGFFGRVDWYSGDKKSAKDFTAMGNSDDLLRVGGGVDWTQSDSFNGYVHTVDVQWENSAGLSIFVAYVANYLDASGGDGYNWGLVGQAGYMLDQDWEVFGRVGYMNLDEDLLAAGADDDYWEMTIGVNRYFKGHNAKMTIDFTYLPDGSPSEQTGLGIKANSESQWLVRGQFQLVL